MIFFYLTTCCHPGSDGNKMCKGEILVFLYYRLTKQFTLK